MARPTELTQELIAAVEVNLADCLYLETVADLLAISQETFHVWLKAGTRLARDVDKGRRLPHGQHGGLTDHEHLQVEFSEAIKRGQAQTIVKNVKIIGEAAKAQWQAAAWLLERRHPDLFGSLVKELRLAQKAIQELQKNQTHANSHPPAAAPG